MASRISELRDRISVRHQIALLAGLLCVATAVVVAFVAGTIARQESARTTEEALVALAGEMASRLDRQMFERYREIKNTAGLRPLEDIWIDDRDSVRAVLAQIQSTLPEYAWIGLAAPDGTVLAATGGLLEGVSVAERPWFVRGLEGVTVEDVHDAKLLSTLLTASPDGEPFRFVDVAAPVAGSDGRPAGVLGAHLSWRWAEDVKTDVLDIREEREDVEIMVYARNGEMLIGPADAGRLPPEMVAEASRLGALTGDGNGFLTAIVPTTGLDDYPGLGWVVLARVPAVTALQPANRLFLVILAVGAAIAALSSALVFLLTGVALRPLARLTRSIDQVGPDSATIDVQHGFPEVVQLSASLRSMLRRLGLAEAREREARDMAAEVRSQAARQARQMGDDMEALRHLADTDALTGLLNRRAILTEGEAAFQALRRNESTALAALMIDVDHFKQVNDGYGHAAGDRVIATLAGILRHGTRETDRVGRIGGEEFLVLMPGVEQGLAIMVAERIRAAVVAMPITWEGDALPVSVSIGASVVEDADGSIADLIGRADGALYAAKSGGRNQTVFRSRAAS